MKKLSFLQRGFTLIELLIVIAVLGVLASGIIAAIDPLEQLARTRDSNMKTTVAELGRGMLAYGVTHNGNYLTVPLNDLVWLTSLKNAGEIKIVPTRTVVISQCSAAAGKSVEQNFCYSSLPSASPTDFIIYATPESKSVKASCTSSQVAWYVYSAAAGRAGVVCTANATTEPAVGVTTFAGP